VTRTIEIPAGELAIQASRAGGPGGQHVNTSSTRVEVVWSVARTAVLDDVERARVLQKLASRVDSTGSLRVAASDTRSQRQNRQLAIERLHALVARALVVPRPRKPTRRPRSADEARLREKKRRGERKRGRGGAHED
jgi:ribosome-associated protein